MIIQKVIKGINGIDATQVQEIFQLGILCRWWQYVDPLPQREVPQRLTERGLLWHQNHYADPDLLEGGRPFYERTPFISTTAGTVERDTVLKTNILTPAWQQALAFATQDLSSDGYLFYCYVFTLEKQAVEQRYFAEELRELHVYPGFSPFQPEGEITAKIIIPPQQIERAEFWPLHKIHADLAQGNIPTPNLSGSALNPLYVFPEAYNNIRDVLT